MNVNECMWMLGLNYPSIIGIVDLVQYIDLILISIIMTIPLCRDYVGR